MKAVLSQLNDDREEVLIAYASRTLGKSERNHALLDKERLAIIFGIKHFHQYVAGRHVTMYTDHKPLLGMMSQGRQIPVMLSPRMTRWCLLLGCYDYELRYRQGKAHQNADALSRLPLTNMRDKAAPPGDVLMLEAKECTPLTGQRIARLTKEDSVLSQVYQGLQDGTTTN